MVAAPAGGPSAGTFESTFNGATADGAWSLFVYDDDGTNASGSVTGGWCLDITQASGAATTTTVTTAPNPSLTGVGVSVTALSLIHIWIVDVVVIGPAPAVVAVPVVQLGSIEFAAGGKAGGEFDGSAALAPAIADKEVERGAESIAYDVAVAVLGGDHFRGVACTLQPGH